MNRTIMYWIVVLTLVSMVGLSGCIHKSKCDCVCNQVPTDSINGHAWVDMGTSVKWATTNVGATMPKANGDYFAWGEVNPAVDSNYNENNCCLYGDSTVACIAGDANYDPARANWGSTWRLPTRTEWRELATKCEWKWYGSGYKVTAKNGNVIYLPAAGSRWNTFSSVENRHGRYWSATSSYFPTKAWALVFTPDHEGMCDDVRSLGFSVRPVSE